MSRFDYVKYDDVAIAQQARAKELVSEMESIILSMKRKSIEIHTFLQEIKSNRAYKLAKGRLVEATLDEDHCIRALEECYMWIGKGIRDDQIARNGSAELQEGRGNE